MLNDVEDLHGFLDVADLGLLSDDEVDVHVGVDEIPVGAAAHGALDAHQAVLLRAHTAVTGTVTVTVLPAQHEGTSKHSTSHSHRGEKSDA